MIVDFRKEKGRNPWVSIINDEPVDIVHSFKYLGTIFEDNLGWELNTEAIEIPGSNPGAALIFIIYHYNIDPVIGHADCCFECLWVKATLPRRCKQGHHFYFGGIYFPPSAPAGDSLIEHIIETIDTIRSVDSYAPIFVLGDFNQLNTDDIETRVGFSQVVNFPTRKGAILDKVFMNYPDIYTAPKRLAPLGRSDHNAILIHPKTEVPRNMCHKIKTQPYRDSSVRCFGQWVTAYEWDNVYNIVDAESKTDEFISLLNGAYSDKFPVITKRVREADRPWMTSKVRNLLDARQKSYEKHGKTQEWRNLRNMVEAGIREAKQSYYRNSLKNLKSNNAAKWHKGIKQLCNMKKHTTFSMPGHSDEDIAENINSHFSSICNKLTPLDIKKLPAYLPANDKPPYIFVGQVKALLSKLVPIKAGHPEDLPARLIRDFAPELAPPIADIFNCALKEGTFPSAWKKATAIPIPKVNSVKSLNDLRPISLTPILARVFESFLVKWIVEDINISLDSRQFGSRKKSSTSHYLISLIDSVLKDLECGGTYVNLCAIDFTKAFDLVDHSILIKKLIDIGVRSSIIPTICSFLTDRTMNTKYTGCTSTSSKITCGVQQGTKLGPVLFLVLINDACVGSCRRWKYVDDLTLGEVVSKGARPTMQEMLNDVNDWCRKNNMIPKPSKCHIMTVNFLKDISVDAASPIFNLNGSNLDVVEHMRLLGVIIQSNLKWDLNTQDIVSRASRRLFALCILKKVNVVLDDLITVYTSYIRPILEYACQVWHGAITKKMANSIETIQKRACRIMLGATYISYDNALEVTGLPSLGARRDTLVLSFGRGLLKSNCFRDMLPPCRGQKRTLRSNTTSTGSLLPPRCKTERYQRSAIPTIVKFINAN
ncbi:uncharacterized protein [Antedon mediterranea]|uniref:uncharacterized protein n=1 Tax=Antedon mediterranea TaxID=105859 RepID=UPI003AF4FB5F